LAAQDDARPATKLLVGRRYPPSAAPLYRERAAEEEGELVWWPKSLIMSLRQSDRATM
jgi:hypothetical protein